MKLFSFTSSRNGTLVKVFGLYFALNPWGNCFSPAVCFNAPMMKSWTDKKGVVHHAARCILTFRTAHQTETRLYWRGGLRFDWNSSHIARLFGKGFDAPHGYCWQYQGWMGNHVDV